MLQNSGAQRACSPCSGPLSPISWKDKLVVSNGSLVARRHRLSALWDLGHVTLQGAQSMGVSPRLASSPSCTFIPLTVSPLQRGAHPCLWPHRNKGTEGD